MVNGLWVDAVRASSRWKAMLKTVVGLGFYSMQKHLAWVAKVDNPNWRQQVDRQGGLRRSNGECLKQVLKGSVDRPTTPTPSTQVDGWQRRLLPPVV